VSGTDWIDLVQDGNQWRALVNTVMDLRLPQNAGKFLNNCTTGSFSRRPQLHEVSYTGSEELTSLACGTRFLLLTLQHSAQFLLRAAVLPGARVS
jgi:hypothetical protein